MNEGLFLRIFWRGIKQNEEHQVSSNFVRGNAFLKKQRSDKMARLVWTDWKVMITQITTRIITLVSGKKKHFWMHNMPNLEAPQNLEGYKRRQPCQFRCKHLRIWGFIGHRFNESGQLKRRRPLAAWMNKATLKWFTYNFNYMSKLINNSWNFSIFQIYNNFM